MAKRKLVDLDDAEDGEWQDRFQVVAKYSPDQPRDPDGKWAGGGALDEVGAPEGAEPIFGSAPGEPKLWDGGYAPGTGAAHLSHLVPPPMASGPNVMWVGPGENDYELRSLVETRAAREAGATVTWRAIDPDEPHTGRDAMWPTTYHNATGGGYVDKSPENPPGVSAQAMKYWSTPGTKRAENEGANPQHSVIRAAADRHFGVAGSKRDTIVVDRLSDERAEAMAKNLVQAIAKAPPSQPTLWRGVGNEHGQTLHGLKVGDRVQFTLGSHSRDGTVAMGYAGSGEYSTVLRVLPGARGVANRRYFWQDQEVVTGGTFTVEGRSLFERGGTKVLVLDVRQTEVFKW